MAMLSLAVCLTSGKSCEAEGYPFLIRATAWSGPLFLSVGPCAARTIPAVQDPCNLKFCSREHLINELLSFEKHHTLRLSYLNVSQLSALINAFVGKALQSCESCRSQSREQVVRMSSDSDDRVSDHGRQIVESIEPIEDVAMYDADSLDDGNQEMSATSLYPPPQRVVKQEPVSDDELEESEDSREDSESPEAAADPGPKTANKIGDSDGGHLTSRNKKQPRKHERHKGHRGHKVARVKDHKFASEDENELPQSQPPPSYQVPLGIKRESSSQTSGSTGDTDSGGSHIEEGLSRERSTPSKEKSRKRKKSTYGAAPEATNDTREMQHVKKTKRSINRAYLDMLNQDIEYVASQGCLTDHERADGRAVLPSSQIGLTLWSSREKELFFEALGRLGRDNTAGIAERIGTKGEMEVRQYLKLLQDALTHRRRQNELEPLGLEDIPSAVEISNECCQALDEVADSIAAKQDRAEVAEEEHKLGPNWLVSQESCKTLEAEVKEDTSKSAGIFRTKEWLALSERFFMNAPNAQGNWHAVDGQAPSIQLTTLDEFQSLVVTLTKRLIAASHYTAMTRIRSESGYNQEVRAFVRSKDVQAAALSLGMATQKPPLTECVKRLGLSVYENPPKPDEDNDMESMSVSDVEVALGIEGLRNVSHLRHQMGRIALSDATSLLSDSSMESTIESVEESDEASSSDDDGSQGEEEDIKAEADEAILYSAVNPPQTKRDRQALYRRIKAEREQERYADAVDACQSYQEEMKMWELLGQQPPEYLTDPGSPPAGRRLNLSVDIGYSVGKDWRAKTRTISEWEAQYANFH